VQPSGFTLVELLVVMAILAVLMGLIAGGVIRAREVGGRIACANNQRQIGLALHSYHIDHGFLPPGMVCSADTVLHSESTGFTCLLPYLEENTAAQLYQFDQPWYNLSNAAAVAIPVKTFYCPSNRTQGSISLTAISSQWSASVPLPPTPPLAITPSARAPTAVWCATAARCRCRCAASSALCRTTRRRAFAWRT